MPAALIRRFHEAKTKNLPTVTVWGTGTLRREFLYGDDLADSCVFAIKHYSDLAHRAICSTSRSSAHSAGARQDQRRPWDRRYIF